MKRYVIPALAALGLAGCAPLIVPPIKLGTIGHYFTPTIGKNGEQGFTYGITGDGNPSSAEELAKHEQLIAQELGRRQFCMKGYEIVSTTNSRAEGGTSYVSNIVGRCR